MKDHLRNKFLAGVFAALPIAVTGFLVYYVETQTRSLFHINIPFVGVVLALVCIYLLGVLVTSLLGKWMLGVADRLLSRLPGLKELYSAWKQVTITPGGSQGIFSRVVLVGDEAGQRTIGFSSGEGIPGDPQTTCVFVPAAPNPTSGRLYFVPLASCRFLETTPEEAFKLILSGGNYVPASIGLETSRLSSTASA